MLLAISNVYPVEFGQRSKTFCWPDEAALDSVTSLLEESPSCVSIALLSAYMHLFITYTPL